MPGPAKSAVAELFTAAIKAHQAGMLGEAERQYRSIIALDPGHANSLHNLGLIALHAGHAADAADLISRAAVADLFHKQKDPITLIKLKEVYEFLENTIDRFEDVADVLQNVAVKNS